MPAFFRKFNFPRKRRSSVFGFGKLVVTVTRVFYDSTPLLSAALLKEFTIVMAITHVTMSTWSPYFWICSRIISRCSLCYFSSFEAMSIPSKQQHSNVNPCSTASKRCCMACAAFHWPNVTMMNWHNSEFKTMFWGGRWLMLRPRLKILHHLE